MAAAENTGTEKPEAQVEEHDDGTAVYVDPSAPATETASHEDDDNEGEEASAAVAHDNDDPDAGPTEAEELRLAATDAAREAIRARRRRERKEKKAAQVEREEGLRRDLAREREARQQLEERFNVMDRRASGAELAQLDNAIIQGNANAEELMERMTQAVNTSNGAAQAEALKQLLSTRERVKELQSIRQRIATPQRPAQTIDPTVANKVQGWVAKNPWYNVKGGDDDSMVVLGLDSGLVRDGYRPDSDAYWEELDRRARKYLPHRYRAPSSGSGAGGGNEGRLPSDERKPGKTTVSGSGREAAGSGRAVGYRISAERVKALKDANMWDNPVERNRMIKQYIEYDKANPPKT